MTSLEVPTEPRCHGFISEILFGFRRIQPSDRATLIHPREIVIEGVKISLPLAANVRDEAAIKLHNEAGEVVEVVSVNLKDALIHHVVIKHIREDERPRSPMSRPKN